MKLKINVLVIMGLIILGLSCKNEKGANQLVEIEKGINNKKISGLYVSWDPSEAEGNFYFFEEKKLHIFWRYDKESKVHEYAASFDYYIEDETIYACNNVLICNDKNDLSQFEARYRILSIEIMNDDITKNQQIVKLKAKHFDSPLILSKVD